MTSTCIRTNWTGCDRNPGADARRAPPTGCAEGEASTATAVASDPAERLDRDRPCAPRRPAGKPRFQKLRDPRGSGTLPRCLGRRLGRWPHLSDSLRADWGRRDLRWPCRTDGTGCGAVHRRVRRFLAGGYPSRLGECQGGGSIGSIRPSRAPSRQTKSLTRSPVGCQPTPSVPLTSKSLFHKALSRGHRHDRPKRSGGLSMVLLGGTLH